MDVEEEIFDEEMDIYILENEKEIKENKEVEKDVIKKLEKVVDIM